MSNSIAPFYVAGGTIPREAPSYICRRADAELYDNLLRGQFCYVLTSRQMGKSSLMVRTAARLQETKVAVAVVDLTAQGQELTAAQWYDSLLAQIGEQLYLEEELDGFVAANRSLSPLQRWREAIREIVRTWHKQRIVIFIDEIDITRSLPFSTDEFFAAIRELYNSRAREPELNRLTFCLLGVATPSDLIRDTRTTPFNIGKRIELTDFTVEEAEPLSEGLVLHKDAQLPTGNRGIHEGPPPPRLAGTHADRISVGKDLLSRILYWTGGHPYLTQRLCQAVAEMQHRNSEGRIIADSGSTAHTAPNLPSLTSGLVRKNCKITPALVDRLCAEMYFGADSENRDDNLAFVRNRLLNNQEVELTGLLLLYGHVLKGRMVPADENNTTVSVLCLCGIVRGMDNLLRSRNRIYARVFDLKWVRMHLPGAEVRRQRAAFQRGVMRASGVFAFLTFLVGGMAVVAFRQAQRADFYATEESRARNAADGLLYVSDMNVAQQAWEDGDTGQTLELLEAHRPKVGEPDRRDFEWRYLWAQCHLAQLVLDSHQRSLLSMAISPDGRLLASGGANGTIKLWNTSTWQVTGALTGHTKYVLCVTFSPDGRTLASAGEDTTVRLWDVSSRQRIATLQGHKRRVSAAAFSPNGSMLVTADADGTAWIWDIATRKRIQKLTIKEPVNAVAFSPNNRLLAVGGFNHGTRLWDSTTWRQVGHDLNESDTVSSLSFSHSGTILAVGTSGGSTVLWNVRAQRKMVSCQRHKDYVNSVVFSGDDSTLLTASWDNTLNLWNIPSGKLIATLKGHTDRVTSAVFLKDDTVLASCSSDGTLRLWVRERASKAPLWQASPNDYNVAAFSPDGRCLATGGGEGNVSLWDVALQTRTGTLMAHHGPILSIAFSPDGKMLVSSSRDQTVQLWDRATGREIASVRRLKMQGLVAWSPYGSLLAVANWKDSTLHLWNTATWQETGAPFLRSKEKLLCTAFSPDNKTLAVADDSSRNRITLWDVVTHRKSVLPNGHMNSIECLSFSPDGHLLASCSFDRTIRLWDVSARREVACMKGHRKPVTSVSFSPDGRILASGSDDKTVRLWSVTAHRETATLRGHNGRVHSVAFSPDRNTLVSADVDGMIHLWRASPVKEEGFLKEMPNGRSLSPRE